MGANRVRNVTFATSEFDTWTEWTEWSRCSKSCGKGGMKLRHRICPNKTCKGDNREETICNNPLCHSWAQWSNWSQCSMTCVEKNARNIPKTYRVQHCRSNSLIQEELHRRKRIQKDFFESEVCEDDHAIRTDVKSCPLQVCPSWAKWSNWSDCSQSCDGGHRQRYRKCIHSNGDDGDGTCVGIFAEEQECNQKKCLATMINWTAWSDWSPCSKSCGIGMKQRSRNCTKVKSSTRKDITVYARKVHFKNIEEANKLCGEMIEKPIAEKEMKLLRGGLKIIPLPRQVDSRWCKIKTRCNDDSNIDFEGIQTESKVPKFIIFETDFVLETDAIKLNGIYKRVTRQGQSAEAYPIYRKYDGRGKIYIERDDATGHWRVKLRSWLKTDKYLMDLDPLNRLANNPVDAHINDCEVKKNEFNLETYETYEWFEQCRVLPNIKSTSLPKRINVTIQDFDFEGRAVGELTSLDEMRLNMTERWVSHFHDALLNKYQGLYKVVEKNAYASIFNDRNDSFVYQSSLQMGRPLYQHLDRAGVPTQRYLQFRMDLALAHAWQAFDSGNKMDESKPIYDFWVFYYLEDGIKEYPELGVYSKAPTLTPVDLEMKRGDLLDPTVQLLANVPLDGEKFKWIHCTSDHNSPWIDFKPFKLT